MFGGLRSKIESYYTGYREVTIPNPNVVELPNPLLIRYLTSGNREKAQGHFMAIQGTIDAVLDEAFRQAEASPLANATTARIIERLITSLNQDGREIVERNRDQVSQAISVGVRLAKLDGKRLGERPPVAMGFHLEAVGKVGSRFSDEIGWAAQYCASSIFFVVRSGKEIG